MSLFPAYSNVKSGFNDAVDKGKEWLSNSSFDLGGATSAIFNAENESSKKIDYSTKCDGKSKHKHQKKVKEKEKKRKKKKRKKSECELSDIISKEPDLYVIDRVKQPSFLTYKTLARPLTPRYQVHFKGILGLNYFENVKSKSHKRYYIYCKCKADEGNISEDKEVLISKKVEEFSKKLNDTSDISDWIEFVEFQDQYFRSQNISYNSESEKKRAVFQKKLDILEKAIHFNPKCEKLHLYWMNVANEILPIDELQCRIEKMVKQSPELLSLWLNLISVRQQSLALCTFPSVSELYKRALNGLQSVKTIKIIEKDSRLLELLVYYCKFLDQCGHWEILWTILKNNFNLNFGKEFKFDIFIQDQKVKDLENEIISNDKQPIWVTWKRIEILREGVHFLPVVESLDYPQRCVSTEDIMDFILHFHRDINFELIVNFIMLLKVPLLPSSNSTFKILYKNSMTWILDSPELILSSVFHSPSVFIKVRHLRRLVDLTRGPQYLRVMEGQLEFLELIQKTFEGFIGFLDGSQKLALALWWLRFNRWLCILDRYNLANLQVSTKKMKYFFRDFMKNTENRDNLLFYCEYALFEYNQGNAEASIKTLKTLISSRPSVFCLSDENEKASFCFIHKCLCEIYIKLGRTANAIQILTNLVVGTVDCDITSDSISLALHKYKHVSIELIYEIKDTCPSLWQLFIPQYTLEWISCYMWLLALVKSTQYMMNCMEEISAPLKGCDDEYAEYARELLWETTCVIHWALDRDNIESITKTLNIGLTEFPNNLKIASLWASRKLEEYGLWWKFTQSFLTSPTILNSIILVCVALERLEIDNEGLKNRVKSLFQKVLVNEGKLSSVIHCLRLNFLKDCDSVSLDAAQVHAIESCPWSKGVYMAAVSVLPNKLMQLTDVLIEKELRIHVTPDEIQEMRD